MPSGKASRIAALAGAGAKVGVNYLKHYGRRAVGGGNVRTALDEAEAGAVYDTFSRLKGGPLKLAQMLIIPVATFKLMQVETLDETVRGADGFGSTD